MNISLKIQFLEFIYKWTSLHKKEMEIRKFCYEIGGEVA